MCTALFLYDSHPALLLLLLFNRDEFYDRPTKEAHFWEDKPDILAGRDLQGGGTWLGVTRSGRFAFLTNFREPGFNSVANSPSRGALTVGFLEGQQSPEEYLHSLDPGAYNGMNLVVGDLRSHSVAYLTNRGRGDSLKGPRALEPGVYGISNGVLGDPWVKVDKGCAALRALAGGAALSEGAVPWDALFGTVLGDRERVLDDAQLPRTGMPLEVERAFSSAFVEPFSRMGRPYGTQSQTVVAVWRDGRAELRQRYRGVGPEWQEVQHRLTLAGFQEGQGGREGAAAALSAAQGCPNGMPTCCAH